MKKSSLLWLAVFFFLPLFSTEVLAQQRKHKCLRPASSSSKPVREMGEIKIPKLVKQVPIFPNPKEIKNPFVGKLAFELLINEEGKVECAEYIGEEAVSSEVLKMAKSALLKFEYEIPRDAIGNPVAVYWVAAILIEPGR